jgi:anti-sigma regulatory factor (Ser/Thr protein kinase)
MRMVYRTQVNGSLNMSALPQLLDPILPGGGAARVCDEIVLDLSEVTFVTPGGLAPFAALVESVRAELPPLRLEAPADPGCRFYLASSGFLQMLQGVATVRGADGLDGVRPGSAPETVLPLTRLGQDADLEALVAHLERKLDQLLGCADDAWSETKGRIISAVQEICANVFQHAGGAPGWVSAQKYRPRNGSNPFLEVSIADAGVGIRRSLAGRYPEFAVAQDGEVLERMVRERLSRHTNPVRGCGYFTLQESTSRLDGSFGLRSGSGGVRRERRSRQVVRASDLPLWPGTHLEMRVTCASERAPEGSA